MNIKKILGFIFFLTFFLDINIYSQGFRYGAPLHKIFQAKDYKGHPQVWSICELRDGEIMFGTTRGVVLFNGTSFHLYFSPYSFRFLYNDSVNNRVYYGGDNSFGYIYKDSIGEYKMVVLSDSLPDKYKDFVYAFGLNKYKDYIYIVGFHRFFVYKGDSLIKTFRPKTDFRFLYNLGNASYYTFEIGTGLLKVMPDTLLPVPDNNVVAMRGVNDMVKWDDTTYLVAVARPYELYFYNKVKRKYSLINKLPPVIKNPIAVKILKDGKIAIGTKNNGVFILNRDFSIYSIFNVDNGLIDNHISFLFQDRFNNLWVATYSGIGVIYDYNGFFEIDNKKLGLHGLITSLLISDSSAFFATSTGLYHYYISTNISSKNPIKFDKIYLPSSQVLTLLSTKYGDILITSDKGIVRYKENKIQDIIPNIPTLTIVPSRLFDNIIYASTTSGLIIIKNKGDDWIPIDTIKIPKFFRKVWEKDEHTLYVRTDDRIFVRINSKKPISLGKNTFDFKKLFQYNFFNFMMNDTIFGLIGRDVYFLDYKTDSFVRLSSWKVFYNEKEAFPLSDIQSVNLKRDTNYIVSCGSTFTKFRISGTNIYISNEDFWGLNSSDIYSVSYDSLNNLVWGASIDKIYNVPINYKSKRHSFKVLIYSVSLTNDSTLALNGINRFVELPYKYNSIRFTYNAIFYEYPKSINYSYKLLNFDTSWSKYSTETFTTYTNLHPGTYTFMVKAKNIYGDESNVATFSFTILPPWYMTWWAYIFYLFLLIVVIILIVKYYTYRLKQKNIELEKIVEERTKEVKNKNKELLGKNKQIMEQVEEIKQKNNELFKKNTKITESIQYAKKIQEAIVPDENLLKSYFPKSFVLSYPRDIVSGDFFWVHKINDKENIIALADCTGHGVPGAFMSIIGNTLLNKIVKENGVYEPSEILSLLHIGVVEALQNGNEGDAIAEDGMDVIVCKVNDKEKTIKISSANQIGFFFIDDNFEIIYGDAFSIGDPFAKGEQISFVDYEYIYQNKAIFYLTSDGYYDQLGGDRKKKFSTKRFSELLKKAKDLPIKEQKQFFIKQLEDWKGDLPQLDDILLIGIRLK